MDGGGVDFFSGVPPFLAVSAMRDNLFFFAEW